MKLNRAQWTTAARSRCMSVPKKIVAPKMRWNEATSRRYWEPPCWIPNVSSISAALLKVIRADCWRTAIVARKIGKEPILSPGESTARITGDLEHESRSEEH